MGVLATYLSVHHMHAVFVEAREGIASPETGVTDSCESFCGSWESNSGSLGKQSVLLTT